MNQMRRIVSKVVVPMALVLSPLCHAETTLQPGYETATRTVNFADLDLNGAEGVTALYNRIRFAAEQVCVTPLLARVIDLAQRQQRCQQQAIAEAVREVNSPSLTRLHRDRSGQ
jgi:UrcA family protein